MVRITWYNYNQLITSGAPLPQKSMDIETHMRYPHVMTRDIMEEIIEEFQTSNGIS